MVSDITLQPAPNSRWRLFAILIGLGVVGIAGGLPLNATLIAEAAPDEPLATTLAAASLSLLVPVMLAALAYVTLGARLGLHAPTLQALSGRRPWWPPLRRGLPIAAILAVAAFAVALGLDFTVFDPVRARFDAPATPMATHLLASLYGGLVEELLMRAGLMTVLAWLLAVVARQAAGQTPTWIVWTSIVLAALAFGALHLPATALLIGLDPLTIARGLLVNASFGIAFGWLTWRRGLDIAMVSHVIADVLLISTQHLLP